MSFLTLMTGLTRDSHSPPGSLPGVRQELKKFKPAAQSAVKYYPFNVHRSSSLCRSSAHPPDTVAGSALYLF